MNTFFDGSGPYGNAVGLDLGTGVAVTQVRFAPRLGFADRMVGGSIVASNVDADPYGFGVTVYTITSAPPVGTLTTVALGNSTKYRYWYYVAPDGSYGNIAELEFDG